MTVTASVFLRRGGQHRIENGHPDIVDVYNWRKVFLGRGYVNPKSQIIVRILTTQQETIDRDFFKKRIEAAWEYRKNMMSEPEYCRLINGEGDFIPALTVDKFGKYIVIQTLSLGIDIRKEMIVSILEELFEPEGIYERNDVSVRRLEGLEKQKGYLRGNFPTTIEVRENGIPFYADIEHGQKTGFFYDQRENRQFLKHVSKGAEVLDCFCHTGSFTVHAALYGAKKVTAIDISEEAIMMAKKNAELNHVSDICDFQATNAFDYLRTMSDAGEQFDVVILDPPAFTKSRKAIEGAARGYKEINLRGIKMVRPGGFLITCSCSYHMDRELFKAIIVDAARDAKRILRMVEYRTQAKDHPILPAAEETEYLKFMMVQVM